MVPAPYQPVCEPFDGVPTYRRDYLGPIQPPRPSMKPDTVAFVSCASADDGTEYRNSYTKKVRTGEPLHCDRKTMWN